jgi:hypothetical protein
MYCTNAYDKSVNQCYFSGDTSNPCIGQHLGKITDAAGKVQDAGKRMMAKANQKWTDMKKWGNDICGKHTDSKVNCDASKTCSWCDKDTNCYIYASVNNPCGVGGMISNAKAGIANAWASAKSWWRGSESGTGCTDMVRETGTRAQKAVDAANENLKMACAEVGKSQAFAVRTSLILAKGVANADAKRALQMTNAMEIYSAKLAVNATSEAILDLTDADQALASFKTNNPDCKLKTSNAVQSASAMIVVSATAFLL